MPRAQKKNKKRTLTRAGEPLRNRKKEQGRPKQTFKIYSFEHTPLGFMLKYEVPVVYDIIMLLCRGLEVGQPPYLLVKRVCAGSSDPSLKKDKFRRYLQLYFEHGLCCHRARELTPKQQAYYDGIREKKLAVYVKQNKEAIQYIRTHQG